MGQNTPAGGGRPLCGRLVPTAPRALAGGAPAAAILNLHHDAAARPGQVRARRVAVGRDRAVALRPTVGRGLYGVPQVWHQLRRAGVEVARCRVERLMRTAGPQGARLGKRFFMTTADKAHNTQLVRNERPLARRRRPRVATLGRVHWSTRRGCSIGNVPPFGVEGRPLSSSEQCPAAAAPGRISLHRAGGGSC
jgi:hypothetical protein